MTAHNASGWFNFCPRCSQRYWVNASDRQGKAKRWKNELCEELHACPDFAPLEDEPDWEHDDLCRAVTS